MKQLLRHQSHTISQRRGIAMMLVMVAILVTGGMAVAYFGSRDNSIAISSNVASSSSARVVAESGLDLAVAILETNTNWRTNHIDGVILQDYQVGEGAISITIIDAETELPPTDATLLVRITISSTVEGRTQYTEATATIIPNNDEFDVDYSEFAIFAQNRIAILGVSSVQNWAASPSSSQQPIQIGTLATNPMAVQINSPTNRSILELHTPEHASSMLTTSSLNTTQFTDSLPFLSPPSPPQNVQSLTLFHEQNHDLQSWANWFTSGYSNFNYGHSQQIIIHEGSYEIEELSLTPNQYVEIHGDVIVSIEDDFVMTNATISLAENATLTFHIGGDVEIRSSYIGNENISTNSWMDPSRVQMYGHSDEDWNVSGYSSLKAELYAPASDIDISGFSTICGRIAGEDVSLRGASRVLYDQSLNSGGFADTDSVLYDEDGTLLDEIRQLTQLNPALLDTIERAITQFDDDDDEYEFGNYNSVDWQSEPTDRPHEVIYALLVYGVDTQKWESLVRQTHQSDYDTFVWADYR